MLREFSKSFLIYGMASTVGRFIAIFMMPIYTRVFTPEQYGEMDLIVTVFSFASILGLAQLESAFSRYYYTAKTEEQRRVNVSTAFWLIVSLSMVFGIILAAGAEWLSWRLFQTTQHRRAIMVVAVMVPFANVFTILTVMMRFAKKPWIFTGIILSQLVVQVTSCIVFVVALRMGIIGKFYGQLLGYVAASTALIVYFRKVIGFTVSFERIKNYLRYSLPLVPLIVANWLNVNISRFIMLGYLTIADIGLYSVALKFASVMQLTDNAFSMTWGPTIWETLEKTDHRRVYVRMMKLVTVGVFLAASLMALFSREVLMIITTEAYYAAAPYVGMLAFSAGMAIISQTINLGAGIRKKPEYNTGIFTFTTAMNIGLMFVLVPKYGLIGVPVSLIITNTCKICLGWYFSERLYHIGFPKLYFGVAYAVALIVVLVTSITDGAWLYKLIFAAPLGAVYAVMLFAGNNPPLQWRSLRFKSRVV